MVGPAQALQAELDERNNAGALIELGLGLLAAVIGLLLIWLMARSVTRPILDVAHMLEDIASGEGDLTRRLAYDKKDELGQLAGWFNRFLDKLQPIIADVKRSVQDARGTADQSVRNVRRRGIQDIVPVVIVVTVIRQRPSQVKPVLAWNSNTVRSIRRQLHPMR